MTTTDINDNSDLYFADRETKDLFDAHGLVEKAGDLLRHIEYVDIEDAQDALEDTLAHIVEAEKQLSDSMYDYEEEVAAA